MRLTKTLEDSSTQSAANETDGIKVQTRYKTATGYTYQLTSNPYRAATSAAETDGTMGWTLSTAWSHGRRSEVQTFTEARLADGLRRLQHELDGYLSKRISMETGRLSLTRPGRAGSAKRTRLDS